MSGAQTVWDAKWHRKLREHEKRALVQEKFGEAQPKPSDFKRMDFGAGAYETPAEREKRIYGGHSKGDAA